MRRIPPVLLATTIAISLAAGLSGCAAISVGHDFDLKTFESRVRHKETTRAEIRAWLGEPSGTGSVVHHTGERYDKWIYYYGKGSVSGREPARLKMLEIQFDSTGKVISYNWSGE